MDNETELKQLRQDNVLLKRALLGMDMTYRSYIVGTSSKDEFVSKVVENLSKVEEIYKK